MIVQPQQSLEGHVDWRNLLHCFAVITLIMFFAHSRYTSLMAWHDFACSYFKKYHLSLHNNRCVRLNGCVAGWG